MVDAMKEAHTVYKLLDKNGKIVWVGSTSLPLEEREEEHRFLLMDFEEAVPVGEPYQNKEEAMKAVSRILKGCIEEDGSLPLYTLMGYTAGCFPLAKK